MTREYIGMLYVLFTYKGGLWGSGDLSILARNQKAGGSHLNS